MNIPAMNRLDSGFDEFSLSEDADSKSQGRRRTTESTQNRPHTSSESTPEPQGTVAGRTTSEKRKRRRNPSSGPRRKSTTTSSSEHSNKSPGRGNGSKPSSRRTSCTLVDPSRPARHYRIKSTQTVSSVNHDVDDALALHFRSCTLFQNPQYQSNQPEIHSEQRVTEGQVSPTEVYPVLNFAPDAAAKNGHLLPEGSPPSQSGKGVAATSTIHWNSPSTRRRQYEKMDKAHSGVRGLVRKVFPNCCLPGPPPPKFYDDKKSDAGSVRRFRMDLPDDDEDDEDVKVDNEKMTAMSHNENPRRATTKSKPVTPSTHSKPRRRWSCFE